tara:strand:+ start:5236 stop:6015 length:780 start_codon:yes stop_codon:yes gene_type:complete
MKVDKSVENYQARYQQYVDFERIIDGEYALIAEVLAARINARFSSGNVRFLDVGCGTGRMMQYLLPLLSVDPSVDYLDPSPEALELYRENVPADQLNQGIASDWSSLTTQSHYDIILANNALCGFDCTDYQAVRQFQKRLHPGGITLLTLPSKRGDWVSYGEKYWEEVHGAAFEKTVFEDITRSCDSLGIPHADEFVQAPVSLLGDRTGILETVFSVMMFVDRNQIGEKYTPMFSRFEHDVTGDTLEFVYGVASITNDN